MGEWVGGALLSWSPTAVHGDLGLFEQDLQAKVHSLRLVNLLDGFLFNSNSISGIFFKLEFAVEDLCKGEIVFSPIIYLK